MLRGSMMELRNKGVITCNETIYPLSIVKFENDTLSNSQGLDLITNGMMNDHINNDHEEFESSKKYSEDLMEENNRSKFTLRLYEEAKRCQSFSGRSLRKLPFLALTEFDHGRNSLVTEQEFLTGLHNCITTMQNDLQNV